LGLEYFAPAMLFYYKLILMIMQNQQNQNETALTAERIVRNVIDSDIDKNETAITPIVVFFY
jgi:hypothetical protein